MTHDFNEGRAASRGIAILYGHAFDDAGEPTAGGGKICGRAGRQGRALTPAQAADHGAGDRDAAAFEGRDEEAERDADRRRFRGPTFLIRLRAGRRVGHGGFLSVADARDLHSARRAARAQAGATTRVIEAGGGTVGDMAAALLALALTAEAALAEVEAIHERRLDGTAAEVEAGLEAYDAAAEALIAEVLAAAPALRAIAAGWRP